MQTGDIVFFRGNGLIERMIRFGTWLGAKIRREPVPDWIPHHVEIVKIQDNQPFLYGADAVAGFVRRPAFLRLAGLKEGRDFRIVPIAIHGHRVAVGNAIDALEGTPYQDWIDVLRVWRGGNKDKGSSEIFCSEAVVRVLQDGDVDWVHPLDPDNVSPLKLYLLAQRHV
jgi:hypothetical protein